MGLGLDKQQKYYSNLSTGTISIGTESDDPTNMLTDNGDGTFNVLLDGVYRIVDRVDSNNNPASNNQYFKSRSRILNWSAASNIDHSSITDGNVIVIVDNAGVVSIVKLASDDAFLPMYSAIEPNQNTHNQIGNFTKSGGSILAGSLSTFFAVNNNPYNTMRGIARTMGSINHIGNPITVSPIAATINLARNAGDGFVSDAGYNFTAGLDVNQVTHETTSPVPILLLTRDEVIQGQSFDVNVDDYESSTGVVTSKGGAKASNNFIIAFTTFLVQLLGQDTFTGSSRLTDAIATNEKPEIPILAATGIRASAIAIDSGATDLTLVVQAIFYDMDQFR